MHLFTRYRNPWSIVPPSNRRCTGAFCDRPARPNEGASRSNRQLATVIVTPTGNPLPTVLTAVPLVDDILDVLVPWVEKGAMPLALLCKKRRRSIGLPASYSNTLVRRLRSGQVADDTQGNALLKATVPRLASATSSLPFLQPCRWY